MNLVHLAFLIAASCCLVLSPLRAQTPSPWTPDEHYSADVTLTLKSGATHAYKMYVDSGKYRSEMTEGGMAMVQIIRFDEKKFYSALPAQKMCMEMPFGLADTPDHTMLNAVSSAKFEAVGPDTVDGNAVTKYKMTTAKDSKVYYWWIDPATKAPVKMGPVDGAFTMTWKNYKAGPVDPSLFQPPAGYQIVPMPGGVAPGGP